MLRRRPVRPDPRAVGAGGPGRDLGRHRRRRHRRPRASRPSPSPGPWWQRGHRPVVDPLRGLPPGHRGPAGARGRLHRHRSCRAGAWPGASTLEQRRRPRRPAASPSVQAARAGRPAPPGGGAWPWAAMPASACVLGRRPAAGCRSWWPNRTRCRARPTGWPPGSPGPPPCPSPGTGLPRAVVTGNPVRAEVLAVDRSPAGRRRGPATRSACRADAVVVAAVRRLARRPPHQRGRRRPGPGVAVRAGDGHPPRGRGAGLGRRRPPAPAAVRRCGLRLPAGPVRGPDGPGLRRRRCRRVPGRGQRPWPSWPRSACRRHPHPAARARPATTRRPTPAPWWRPVRPGWSPTPS